MICNSCGGVIGRDCFNPKECEWISRQMEINERHEQQAKINNLEAENMLLQKRIKVLEQHNQSLDSDGKKLSLSAFR